MKILLRLWGIKCLVLLLPTIVYAQNVLEKTAAIESLAEIDYYSKKFGLPIDTKHELYRAIYQKKLKINQVLYHVDQTEHSQLITLSAIVTESQRQIESILTSLDAQRYINSQIKVLDSIKPLTDVERNKLSDLFLKRIKTSKAGYITSLRRTLSLVSTDTSYYARLFKDDIKQLAKTNASIYALKKNLPIEEDKATGKLIFAYQRALSLARYAYAADENKKLAATNEIDKKYKFLLDSILIKDGLQIPFTRYIGLAINNSKDLKISEAQLDSLRNTCIKIQKEKAVFYSKKTTLKYDSRPLEYECLTKILTNGQFNSLLTLALKERAAKIADDKWQLLEKEGMDKGLNMHSTKEQVCSFYLKRLIALERYLYDKPQQTAQLKSIDTGKPQILLKLEAVRKNAALKNNIKGTLTW